MRLSSPGSNDLISHTLRHFVQGTCMGSLPPQDAMTPHAARTLLLTEGEVPDAEMSALPLTSEQPLSPAWWQSPRRALIEDIHDQGYWPRYCAAFLAAPDLSRWHHDPHKTGTRMYRSPGGCFLCGEWSEKKATLQLTSAYRRLTGGGGAPAISRQGSADQAILNSLRRILR